MEGNAVKKSEAPKSMGLKMIGERSFLMDNREREIVELEINKAW